MPAPSKLVKYALAAFVAVSIGAAIYKALPCCSGDGAAEAAAVEAAPAAPAVAASPAARQQKNASVNTLPEKTAVVYYFYTDTRCSSCTTIEEYTREAVAKHFVQPYKGWRVEFRGVNIEDKANEHFVQDYWLNSKAVVVQKFEGDKPRKWGLLKSVWQLLGDKEKFMDYVAAETRKVIDEV